MKKRFILFLYITIFTCVFLSSCGEDYCDNAIKVELKDLDKYIPYTGTDTLRFLHNGTDTQTFVGQGMERFYVTESRKSERNCDKDHEAARVKFENLHTGDIILIDFSFKYRSKSNELSFKYKQHSFDEYIDGGTESYKLNINDQLYSFVSYYSSTKDTSEYIAHCYPQKNNNVGIVKIKYLDDILTLIR